MVYERLGASTLVYIGVQVYVWETPTINQQGNNDTRAPCIEGACGPLGDCVLGVMNGVICVCVSAYRKVCVIGVSY